jgi:hypothetical protein
MELKQRSEASLAGIAGRGCGPGALLALDASTRTLEPAVKSLTRANLELTQYWARRAHAALEAPHNLARCRTPQQGMHETIRLLRAAAEDTRRTGEMVTRLWTMALQQPSPLMTAWLAACQSLVPRPATTQAARPVPAAIQRDVITFPERPARRI